MRAIAAGDGWLDPGVIRNLIAEFDLTMALAGCREGLHAGRDAAQLRQRAEEASALLGWPAPYAECLGAAAPSAAPAALPAFSSGD